LYPLISIPELIFLEFWAVRNKWGDPESGGFQKYWIKKYNMLFFKKDAGIDWHNKGDL